MHPSEFAVFCDDPLEPRANPLVILRKEPDAQVGDLRQVVHVVQVVASAQIVIDDDDPSRERVEIAEPAGVLLAVHLDDGIALARQGA